MCKVQFEEALAYHQRGDLANAELGYRNILQADAGHFDATYLLGLVYLQSGRFVQAEAQLRRATKLNANSANALHDHGNALLELNRPAEALSRYDRAIALAAGFADAFNNRGNALLRLTRLDEALSSFDRAIAVNAEHAIAHYNRGNVLRRLKRHGEALMSYQRAIALNPNYIEAYNNSGNTHLQLHRPDQALASYDKAIALNPIFAESHCNRANALIELRRFNEALAAADRGLSLNSEFALGWRTRGDCLRHLHRNDQSLAAYDRAIALAPDMVSAWAGRARALHELKRHDESAQSWSRLLRLAPDYDGAKGHLAYEKMLVCDWSGLIALAQSIEQDIQAGKMSAEPFGYQALSHSAQDLRRCAELAIQREFPRLSPLCPAGGHGHEKIRVGYLSGEFREHATSALMAELFELHDKEKFELLAFDNGWDDGSAIRRRINTAFDRIVDISRLSDDQAAAAIRQNEIDLLVNLNGFCGRDRNGVFSRRPAPIQVSYLGFPGTMGAEYIDYIVADPIVIPPEHKAFYAEAIAWLPECYQVNDSRRRIAANTPTRTAVGLPENGFVFCCFNNSFKITQDIFDAWMRLLNKAGSSTLWLIEDNAVAVRNLRREANRRGIDPSRLVFAPRLNPADHLARHRLADLFLDTLPYNAHTTASDALWVGVPILTCLGSTFPGRVAASLLHAVAMPELIAHSLDEYEALALRLVQEPALLSSMKAKLAQNRDTCPLFDSKRFARHIEAAYSTMLDRHRRGEQPTHFSVPAITAG